MKRKLVLLLAALAVLSVPQMARGTDIPIFPTGPVFRLTGLAWGSSAPQGFNNNFFFTPLSQHENVCVYVYNNNTTNPHTFTSSINTTGNPAAQTPSDGTWNAVANSGTITASTSPGFPAGLGAVVSGVSQVSVNFTGSSTQAGSPDTALVVISQTPGSCSSGNNFVGSAPNTVASMPPIMAISDGLSQAFDSTFTQANPTATQQLLHVNANGGSRSLYFDKIIITVTANATIQIQPTASAGTTCSASPISNLRFSGPATTAVANNTCTVGPSGFGVGFLVDLAANTPFVFDAKGYVSNAGSTNGLEVLMASALTGSVRITIFWYEK